MAKQYRPVDRDQPFLFPPDMREWLPAGHPVHLVITAVEDHLDSSRRIEELCRTDVAFRLICAGNLPDHVTFARFRSDFPDATAAFFTEVLILCARLGMGRLGTVALDGMKIAASASKAANRTGEGLRKLAAEAVAAHAAADVGPVCAGSLDLAAVGLAIVGVGGDGEHGDAGRGGVEDEGDGAGFGVVAGQGGDPGAVGLGPRCLRRLAAVAGAGVGGGEQGVGAVDLVAGGAEVLSDRAEVGAAGDALLHQPGGLCLVAVGAGAGVDAQLGLQRVGDGAGADEVDQAAGEDRRLGPGG
jgi:transposase